jgi:small conductance mechanosensitive channel
MQLSDFFWVPANWLLVNSPSLISAIIVLVAGWYLSKFAARAVYRLLPRAYGVDKNFAPLLSQVTNYGIKVFAVVTALSFLGVSNTSIYAVLGAAGLAIALALQGTLANIAAGIMLIWLRPIAIGEYITGDGVAGVVIEIGLFGTRLRSTSGLFIFTPNQKLWSSAITNHSREPRRRIDVNISVPESANLPKAQRTLLNVAKSDKRVLIDPAPTVHIESFAGDRVFMQLRAWVATPNYLSALHTITQDAKLTINKELAANQLGTAEVTAVADPHVQGTGQQTDE